jgi:hypothetical protein
VTAPRPRLLADRCSSCVFRPGNLMQLADGRLADLVAANRAEGTLLVCHQTLSYGPHPEQLEALCRGFWDAYADSSAVAQVMGRLFGPDWYEEVPPPDTLGG